MQHTVVVTFQGDVGPLKTRLISAGIAGSVVYPKQAQWQLRATEGVVTAYHTGKVVIQGKNSNWIERIQSVLKKDVSVDEIPDSREIPQDTTSNVVEIESQRYQDTPSLAPVSFVPHIGVDEAGKGDFFGPLVVGAVCVDSLDAAEKLRSIGVRDSKKLSDRTVCEVASLIRSLCPYLSVVVLWPADYNTRYRTIKNANILLAQLHAQAIEEVLEKVPSGECSTAVIDQFSRHESRILDELLENGKKLNIEQMHKGERDVAVAAASILAREGFLSGLEKLSKQYDMTFPKGSSHVIPAGKEFVRKHGAVVLGEVAKTSFRTSLSVTSTFDI